MKRFLLILALLAPLALNAMTRSEAIVALTHPAFGLLVASDFELKLNDKGMPLAAANKIEEKNALASVIGDPAKIDEISVMVVFNKENSTILLLYIPSLVAAAFPEWGDSVKWAGEAMINLSENGGGKKTHTSNGKTVDIQLMQLGGGVVGIANITFK